MQQRFRALSATLPRARRYSVEHSSPDARKIIQADIIIQKQVREQAAGEYSDSQIPDSSCRLPQSNPALGSVVHARGTSSCDTREIASARSIDKQRGVVRHHRASRKSHSLKPAPRERHQNLSPSAIPLHKEERIQDSQHTPSTASLQQAAVRQRRASSHQPRFASSIETKPRVSATRNCAPSKPAAKP